MEQFFQKARMQEHPLRLLDEFLAQEKANETAGKYTDMRFVGYVLEIGYDTITIITSDPFKVAVGGIPRNSMLIMVPDNLERFTPHFTLLRVLESAPTPLSREVQQTYFELQKKSMPELDIFTQSELQWGALKTGILGMFYPHQDKDRENEVEFSGDLNNYVSAHRYRVYAPDDNLLNLIVNSIVPEDGIFPIGSLRLTECRLPLPDAQLPNVPVQVSTKDFMGTRTAMFGKTRLGKSNVVKLIAQSLIETTETAKNVGQLIFDINGEYANDNPQNLSLRSAYSDRCIVYALSPKPSTPSEPLKLHFYEQPETSIKILGSLLAQNNRTSGYIQSFISVELPSIEQVKNIPHNSGDRNRSLRKLQIYWATLAAANYAINNQESNGRTEKDFVDKLPTGKGASRLDPGFSQDLREAVYGQGEVPNPPGTLSELVNELKKVNKFRRENRDSPLLLSKSSKKPIFDADDEALLEFFDPQPGRSGPSLLQPFRKYHDPNAGDFINDILGQLDEGMTVILDLGNANEEVMDYFSVQLSRAVLNHQVEKFSDDKLGDHFIQLYFEEAHNLFPRNDESRSIYSRFAKEGAKYHIGMVYSTQSPATISGDLLAQTENFFVAHLSSRDDVNTLAKEQVAFEHMKDDILSAKTAGYMRMLTRSHRFVVSVQANKFEATMEQD